MKAIHSSIFLSLHLTSSAHAFTPPPNHPIRSIPIPTFHIRNPFTILHSSSTTTETDHPDESNNNNAIPNLKSELLQKITTLRTLQDQDGKISVDFGVKGGEIDAKSRAPKKLDFYTVSERVGRAADSIDETVRALAKVNPTAVATAGFGGGDGEGGGDGGGERPPLEGEWKLLFSTAADASFSRDSKRGDATAGNIVEASRGMITNVIRFAPEVVDEGGKDKTTKPKLVDELRVRLSATAEGPNRINLVFRYVAVKFTRFFFIPVRWTLYIPVPGPTIGKLVIGLSNLKRRILRRTKTQPKRVLPKAFFDVLFLDGDLRVHRTGEDNLFVQARPEWTEAWEAVGV